MSSIPSEERHIQLIAKYCVPNMGDYSAIGSHLSLILERLDLNRSLSPEDKQYIRDKGLFDLSEFVKKLEETGNLDFQILRTPFVRKQKKQIRRKLWEKYDIDYIEASHMRQMMDILLQVEKGARILNEDVLWLTTNEYFYPTLKREYHKNEAVFLRQSFEKSNDPWDAVNASSHYRKANLPSEAANLLGKVDIDSQSDKHLKSALCTTKGGSERDLRKFDAALKFAEKAHLFDTRSFHPCTLIGAINYELGNHTLGDEWFSKAIERGANPKGVDQELRSIFKRASKAQQVELKRHLLNIDPFRYDWAHQTMGGKKYNSKTTNNNSINRKR